MTHDKNGQGVSRNSNAKLWDLLALPVELAVASFAVPARLVQSVVQTVVGRRYPAYPARNRNLPDTNGSTATTSRSSWVTDPPISPKPTPRSISQQELGNLDPNRMVVLGDGLAAGMGEFGLHETNQVWSFPAQLSCQMGAELRQPLIQAPGLECPLVSQRGGIQPPELYQTTVLRAYPPGTPPANLSVPGMMLRDAINQRVEEPIIQPANKVQTAANLIFGLPFLMRSGCNSLPGTVVDAALAQNPRLAVVVLGYSDVMKAAIDRVELTEAEIDQMIRSFELIVDKLCERCALTIASSIPSPFDTAAFSKPESSAEVLRIPCDFLSHQFGLGESDRLTVAGLIEVGNQIISRRFEALDETHVLRSELADVLSRQVAAINQRLALVAKERDCLFFDMAGLFRSLYAPGIVAGTRRLTRDYLGGFFSLNGIYPGATGHAVIANGIIDLLNEAGGSQLPAIDIAQLARWDPVAHYQLAEGPNWIFPGEYATAPRLEKIAPPPGNDRHFCDIYRELRINEIPDKPLKLPPGLEQELPLTKALSFHGDGMRIVDCKDLELARFGSSGELRFDGLALFGSHVRGSLKFKFSPPLDGVTHFTVEFSHGSLDADDGTLSTPGFYRFPLLGVKIVQPPGMLASGDLNLNTGLVDPSTLKLNCVYQNSGLATLARLNPRNFPDPPIITFSNASDNPRVYGSSWSQFRQRRDGKLDFTFHGTAFVPLGRGVVFPLPLPSASGTYPVVSASGSSLHPYLHLSTVELTGRRECAYVAIPTNRTEEFKLCAGRSSFGDLFRLNHPVLGEGLGRSFLAGRLRVQFGERFEDSVPFSVSFLPPAGLLDNPSYAPLQQIFPGKLTRGLLGHDGIVHYPLRSYSLSDTFLVEDPLDIALGAVNIHSGEVIGDFLHRALIGQDLIYALFRVEPRTPKSSFRFRGKASFIRDRRGQLRYRLDSAVFIPYPEGFLFPLPNLATGIPVGPGSSLDPYLQLETVNVKDAPGTMLAGSEHRLIAQTGAVFSCRYVIPSSVSLGNSAKFVCILHNDPDVTFTMTFLASVAFYDAGPEDDGEGRNVVSFTGFGTWSRDPGGLHVATVEISREPGYHYVSIQIDGGEVINFDTRPSILQNPLEPVH